MRRDLPLRRWLAPLVAAALAAVCPGAAAEEDDPSAEADELFHKAGQAYDAGDFALARSLYGKAFEKKKTHDIAAMMAQTELKLGRPCEADVHLAWAVANFPPSLADERRARVMKARADVKKLIGALRVVTTPEDAAVQVDFQPVTPSARRGPFCVAAGDRIVFVSREGFAVERRAVTVEPGEVVTVTAELRRLPAVAAPRASVSGSPSAALDRVPPPPASPVTQLAFSGLFAGLGATMVGAVLIPFAFQKKDEADALSTDMARSYERCPNRAEEYDPTRVSTRCLRLWSLRDDEAGFANAGLASLLVGAAVGAAAGGFLLFRPPASGARPGGPRVTVGAAPDGAFIALKGGF